MPSPFVLVKPRLMAGTWDSGASASVPEFPVLNITTSFDHLVRLPGDSAVATVVVTRTVNTDLACQVPWSVAQTGTNPITAAYFTGSVFPSGTLNFAVGDVTKTVTFALSSGDRPAVELTGVFRLGTPVGAKLGANNQFNFTLSAPLAFPVRADPAEPGWITPPLYATAPNKQFITTVTDLADELSTATAGDTLVLSNSIDANGGIYTLSGIGSTDNPIVLRGNSDKKAAFPELSNAILIMTGQRWVICNLRLRNVQIVIRSATYTQIQQNSFTGYTAGGATSGAIVMDGAGSARYTRIYGNNFFGTFKCCAIYGSAITSTTPWKYLWVRRNLFKGFTDGPANAGSVVTIGPTDTDSTYDCHVHITNNLIKDYAGTGFPIDTGVAGVATFDNTLEVVSSTSKQQVRVRQGCTKPDQFTGNIVDGNLWVAPLNSTVDLGGVSVADGYTVVANNWACLLPTDSQPVATSPTATAKIALARGSLDWSGWPANRTSAPSGRAWPNCAYAFVGGNHIPVVVGDDTTRPWLASDVLVKAANLYVAPNDTARADRNSSTTYGPNHSVSDINTVQVIAEGQYTRIPTRYIESTVGFGLISGLSYPLDARNYSLNTFVNTAKAINLISGYTGPTPPTLTVVSGPSHGSVSLLSGTLTYNPTTNYTGSDSITYRLTDTEGTTMDGTLSITVEAVTLTISAPANVNEGNSGTQTIRFTVTKSGSGACSASWTLTGGVDASDFQSGQAFSGTVSFLAGDTTKFIDFTLKGDTTSEPNEQMTVTLSSPSGCVLGTPYFGTTTIINDDAATTTGRLYNPPHRPTATSQVVTWVLGNAYPGNGDWTKYLLIVCPENATQLRIKQTALKYKGVFIIGGMFNVTGTESRIPVGKTNSVSGDPGNVIQLNFADDMPTGLIGNSNGDPLDGRPFIWLDGIDMDTCWADGDSMGTQMSSWWGDFFSFGTKTTASAGQSNKWCDVYRLRSRIKNGHYFCNFTVNGGGVGHSDVMQNNDAQIRSLNAWKCDDKHFGQGYFAGSGSYVLPNSGWWEISDSVFRCPPKSNAIYTASQAPTWNPIQAIDNSCNPDIVSHETTQYGSPTTITVNPGEYFAVLLGPRNYFQFAAAADSTINAAGIALQNYDIYTGTRVDRNYTSRNMTLGVSGICVTHDPPFHKYYYSGFTGAGGPFNRASGFYTRVAKMDLPATIPLTEAEVGLTRRITSATNLLSYLDNDI